MSRHPASAFRSLSLLASFLLAAATPVSAEEYVRRIRLPVILSAPGADGARWSTELVLANAGGLPARVRFRFRPSGGGAVVEGDDVLPAGRQRLLPDALAYLRSLGLAISEDDVSGSVTATFRGMSEPSVVSMSARITSPSGPGRAGLSLPGFPYAGQGGVIPALRQDAERRTNLSLFHAGVPGDEDIVLSIALHESSGGKPPFTLEERLAPGEFRQLDGVLSRAGLASGYAVVERVQGAASFLVFATVIDRATNDPALVQAQTAYLYRTLPEAVDSPAWRTELSIVNTGPIAGTARLTWMLADGPLDLDVPVAAGAQVTLPDLGAVARARGGALAETLRGPINAYPLNYDVSIFLEARVVSRSPAGKYGVGVDGLERYGGAQYISRVFGLVQDDERRSSLVLANTDGFYSGKAIDLTVELFDGDTGRLASREPLTLPALSSVAFPSVLASRAPGVKNGWAVVTRTAGDNPFHAFSVVNDGPWPGAGTGDGQLVTGESHCIPGTQPEPILASWRGADIYGVIGGGGCSGPLDTDDDFFSNAGSSFSLHENAGSSERTGHLLDGEHEIEVRQHANAPYPFDGTYTGLTDQGLPVILDVVKGDLERMRFSWTRTGGAGCPTGGSVDAGFLAGSPIEPGRAFRFVGTGVAGIGGTLGGELIEGTVSAFWCYAGRIPLFVSATFSARKTATAPPAR